MSVPGDHATVLVAGRELQYKLVESVHQQAHLDQWKTIVANATSTTIINTLVKLFTRHHFPKVIIADLDAKSTSRAFKKFLETYSVNIIFAQPSSV